MLHSNILLMDLHRSENTYYTFEPVIEFNQNILVDNYRTSFIFIFTFLIAKELTGILNPKNSKGANYDGIL